MQTGAITQYIDVAQLVLYAFWIFFACLIIYIRREDKREGYPLESERSAHITVQGWPPIPEPKTFLTAHGGTVQKPDFIADKRRVAAMPTEAWPGAPLSPTGNPMADGVGPAAWAEREDVPDLTFEGEIKIVPLRVAPDFGISNFDVNPQGMAVVGGDGLVAGYISDVWVDRTEPQVRYYEIELKGGARRLVPGGFVRVDTLRRHLVVRSILSTQFAGVPVTKHPDQITLLEEDKVSAYYGGGTLYAEPSRMEPLL